MNLQARDKEIVAKYQTEMTLEELGILHGITRERVRQIISVHGLSRKDGFASKRTQVRREAAKRRQDDKYLKRCGCSFAQYKQILVAGGTGPWKEQRRNAYERGVPWKLTLYEWWAIWEQSGRWENRGRHKGQYCMQRVDDVGAYERGNVFIATTTKNCRDYIQRRIASARESGPNGRIHGTSKSGLKGIYEMYPGGKKPWLAKFSRKYLGTFATKEEAIAAREKFLTLRRSSPKV
jgi:hypothetical protein